MKLEEVAILLIMLCLLVIILSMFSIRFWDSIVKPLLEIFGAGVYLARTPVFLLMLFGGSVLIFRNVRGRR